MEDNKIHKKICELCKETATSICFDCSFYLCDSCFKFLHEKKANSEHKKEPIDPFISMEIKCPYHPNVPMNLFCLDEKSNKYFYLIFILIYSPSMLFVFF